MFLLCWEWCEWERDGQIESRARHRHSLLYEKKMGRHLPSLSLKLLSVLVSWQTVLSACIAISFKFNGVLFNLYAISFYYYGFRIIIMACENRRSHSITVALGDGHSLRFFFASQIFRTFSLTKFYFLYFFRIFAKFWPIFLQLIFVIFCENQILRFSAPTTLDCILFCGMNLPHPFHDGL